MNRLDPLEEWQKGNLAALRAVRYAESAIKDVTVVAYYFRGENEEGDHFWRTEFAFLKTFQTQGVLPSVLVVNKVTPVIQRFCKEYSISIQIADNLIPGRLNTLAIDLVRNLHSRFCTPYVLTIQDDGFPMRPGLEEFLGKWDYIGAPWVHHVTYYDLYPYKYCVGNGGFSLRSKRLCEVAANVYNHWFKHFPYWWYVLGDDTFYCKTLRFWFRKSVQGMLWPTLDEASAFSVECNNDFHKAGVVPLGFHGIDGWRNFNRI